MIFFVLGAGLAAGLETRLLDLEVFFGAALVAFLTGFTTLVCLAISFDKYY